MARRRRPTGRARARGATAPAPAAGRSLRAANHDPARNRRRLFQALPAAIVLLAAWALVVVPAWPGRLNYDALFQYAEARERVYDDVHAPILSALASIPVSIWASPGPIFAACVAAFLASVFVIFRAIFGRPLVAASATAGLAFWPPVLAWLSAMVKDTWYGVFLVTATACVVVAARAGADRRKAGAALAGGFVCLWLAMAARHNGITGMPLLAGALSWAALEPGLFRNPAAISRGERGFYAVLGAALILAFSYMSTTFVSSRLLDATESHVEQQIFTYDLAGVSLERGEILLPEVFYPPQDLARLRAIFNPDSVQSLYAGGPPDFQAAATRDGRQVASLRSTWWRAIRDHPAGYLAVRWRLFRNLMGIPGTDANYYPYQDAIPPNGLGVRTANAVALDVQDAYLDAFTATPLFWAWIPWLLSVAAGGLLLVPPRTTPEERLFAILALSAVAYQAALFFVAIGEDFRFSWPCVVTGWMSAILLGRRCFERREAARIRLRPRRAAGE